MPFDPTGRPSRELIGGVTAPLGNPRPFNYFGRVGTVDDTATIQLAVDASSADGLVIGQAGTFKIDGVVWKDGAQLVNPGSQSTKFIPVASPSAAGLFLLDTGPVQNTLLQGCFIDLTAHPGVMGIYFKAQPIVTGGVLHGGLWYSTFKDIHIIGGTGDDIWLRGGGNLGGDPEAFTGPHQFLKFERVVVVHGDEPTTRALRLSGQVGQVGFDEDCEFDYDLTTIGAGLNILIERDVHDDGTNRSDMAPYDINFHGLTCQNNKQGVKIERAAGVHFFGGHFENVAQGIHADTSAENTTVHGVSFANCGFVGDGSGFGIKNSGGAVSVSDCAFLDSGHPCETHYWSQFDNPLVLYGKHYDQSGLRTQGITPAGLTPASSLDTDVHRTVFITGPSATVINTIVSLLPPGEHLTLRANAGYIVLGDGGNIDIAPYRTPLRVAQDTVVVLAFQDLTGKWVIQSMSGNRGQIRPDGHFVQHSDSPYSIPPDSGTIRVDASAGDVTLKLPSINDTPWNYRIQVKRVDGSGHVVFINGATTPENPDGYGDNVVQLIRQTQALEFERNNLVGTGGWDSVTAANTPVNTLTFGTHLTGTSFDGSAPVTIGTDATSANTASTLVARGASGEFSAGVITMSQGLIGGSAGTTGTKANQNILLYNSSTSNWAGIQANSSGDMCLSVGTSSRFSATLGAAAGVFTLPADLAVVSGNGIAVSGTRRLSVTSTGVDVIGTLTSTSTVNFASGNFVATTTSATISSPITVTTSTGATGLDLSDSSGNTGMSFTPHTSTDGTFIDNRRVGSGTFFRSSSSTAGDRTWLSVTGAGNPTFGFGVTFSSTISVTGTLTVSSADVALTSSFGLVVSGTRRLTATTSGVDVTGALTCTSTANLAGGNLVVTTSSATFISPLTINLSSSARGIDITSSAGLTGISFTPHTASDGVFIDNLRVSSSTFFRCSNASGGDTTWLTVGAGGQATFVGAVIAGTTFKSGAPAGASGAGVVKFGKFVTAAVTPDAAHYIEHEVDGTLYKLQLCT